MDITAGRFLVRCSLDSLDTIYGVLYDSGVRKTKVPSQEEILAFVKKEPLCLGRDVLNVFGPQDNQGQRAAIYKRIADMVRAGYLHRHKQVGGAGYHLEAANRTVIIKKTPLVKRRDEAILRLGIEIDAVKEVMQEQDDRLRAIEDAANRRLNLDRDVAQTTAIAENAMDRIARLEGLFAKLEAIIARLGLAGSDPT